MFWSMQKAILERIIRIRNIWKKINRLLKPGGKILIAIENRLGLKYFAGCREDHVGREFAGIEGYPGIDFVETFSKPELEQMLQKTVFRSLSFIIPIRITNFRRSFIRMNICRSRVIEKKSAEF